MMAALSIEGPVVQYTGPTFCYVVQAIPTVALMANYTMGPGDELKTTLDFILGIIGQETRIGQNSNSINLQNANYIQRNVMLSTLKSSVSFYFLTGIAILRMIYINHTGLIKTNLAEFIVSYAIMISALTLTAIFSFIFLTVPKKGQDLTSLCFNVSKEMEVSTGAIVGDQWQRIAVVGVGTLLVLLELYTYISIFMFLTRHDRSMINILPAYTIAKRKRRNAINLSGHALQFALDLYQMVIAIVLNRWLTEANRHNIRYLSLGYYGMSGFFCIISNGTYRQDVLDMIHFISQLFPRIPNFNVPKSIPARIQNLQSLSEVLLVWSNNPEQ